MRVQLLGRAMQAFADQQSRPARQLRLSHLFSVSGKEPALVTQLPRKCPYFAKEGFQRMRAAHRRERDHRLHFLQPPCL